MARPGDRDELDGPARRAVRDGRGYRPRRSWPPKAGSGRAQVVTTLVAIGDVRRVTDPGDARAKLM